MTTRSILALLLAAGRGSRLSENSSKPLTSWRGKSLVVRSLEPYLEWLKASRSSVHLRLIVGFQGEQVARHLEKTVVSLSNWSRILTGTAGCLALFGLDWQPTLSSRSMEC